MPLLRLALRVARTAGWSGSGVSVFQLLSGAAAVGAGAVYAAAASRWTKGVVGPAVAAACAALVLFDPVGVRFAVQPKPYSLALLFVVLALAELSANEEPTPRRCAWLGLCCAVACGFTAICLGVLPAAALRAWGRKAGRGRRFAALGGAFGAGLGAVAVAGLLQLPAAFAGPDGGWAATLSCGSNGFQFGPPV